MTSEEELKRKIDAGERLTKIEKILYLRMSQGLGLCEAVETLRKTGNDFDGPWVN